MTSQEAEELGLQKYIFGDGYCNQILEIEEDGTVKWYDRDKDCIISGHVYELDSNELYVRDDNGYEKCFPVEFGDR